MKVCTYALQGIQLHKDINSQDPKVEKVTSELSVFLVNTSTLL